MFKFFKNVVKFIVLCIVGVFVFSYYSINKSINEDEAAQAAIPPVISNVKPSEITNLAKKTTDAQFENFVNGYKNKRVTWNGKISDVKKCTFSDCYTVNITFKTNSYNSITSRIDMAADVALALNLNQKITLTGTITGVREAIGMVFVDFNKNTVVIK